MIIVGLTGNYGMGKSTVAQMFRELGAITIGTDDIVHELLEDVTVIYEIKKVFGEDIIQKTEGREQKTDIRRQTSEDRHQKTEDREQKTEDRQQETEGRQRKPEINKKLLAEIVFEHSHMRISLENILHPRVFKKIDEGIAKITDTSAIVIVEAPVIFERGYQNRFDKIITVWTSEDIAGQRLSKKGISEDDTKKRLKSQFPVEMKISKSDFTIDNSKDIENTRRQVEEVYIKLVSKVYGLT